MELTFFGPFAAPSTFPSGSSPKGLQERFVYVVCLFGTPILFVYLYYHAVNMCKYIVYFVFGEICHNIQSKFMLPYVNKLPLGNPASFWEDEGRGFCEFTAFIELVYPVGDANYILAICTKIMKNAYKKKKLTIIGQKMFFF